MSENLYRQDFYAWTQQQAALLQAEELEQLDLPNLIEEIEAMGASQRNELTNRLKVLLMHLLKWRYQPQRNKGSSWRKTIQTQRFAITDLLEDNPSLRRELPAAFAKAYPRARRDAVQETGLAAVTFPAVCPWLIEQILDDEWFPSAGQ